GRDENKFETMGLTPVKSELVHAPYVKEFPVNLICRLYKTLELGLHTQFIGEILEVLADDDTLDHRNMPLMEKVNPFIYDSAQRTYYSVGSRLDKAFVKVK
ncbi:MAG: hypothetical protein QG635_1769, partial [Bacteroidota bacterium]|nr:hypothetical protein [Bacteroidota bacterium]